VLAQMEGEGAGACLGLTLTPVLCEQLADGYIQDRFVAYLKTMQENSERDVNDFVYFNDGARKALAQEYYEEYRRRLLAFLAIDGDLLGAFASFEKQQMIETLGSCATHAFLPGIRDERSVREQVLIGLESHERHLGVRPRGFWLPECAYRKGVEDVLEREGIEYLIVDSTALGGRPSGRPYLIGDSRVVALARSDRAHANAWDESTGYPTDDRYVDSTKYYQGSGLHYWKVSGPDVPIEAKDIYEPGPARVRALEHAGHYYMDIASEIESDIVEAAGGDGGFNDPPLVLAAYDTEFLGHGWKEGLYWLEIALRSLAAADSIRIVLPGQFLRECGDRARVDLAETTWGAGKDHSTWLNPQTEWMWEELRAAQDRLRRLQAAALPLERSRLERRLLAQIARECLLMESSDWPYMVAKDRARDYAIERFRSHLGRFRKLADALESGETEGIETVLGEIEEADNIFANLDLDVVSGQ
jgi:1,4-alpha-glucan branching enzyme